ncbi:hypothetical protein TraAM80_08339 [Trypanosoma rangeli]|uniref:RanBP2-type domain-containing protein n=1 Tax=Trypanosoma rangeli TaxID=5698 RepID=A0A3R7MAL9_TRYRA|nr:uncharacterized protein TraAM80_08339 [Trypanosoma rangeli]RNE99172.1 hypothetical protein TraAM80_08339 [Trypanosoma rangeli]|eukprot:RNE99172.1 hypothetical protein TraAM80_08339 [Trypanosoma rangeli]
MDFLRRTFAEARLRYHVSKVFVEASATPAKLSAEFLSLVEEHPLVVLSLLRDHLQTGSPHAYAYLQLLEKIVDACSFSFHAAMATDHALQEKLVQLAVTRVEGAEKRKVRRLARLTLLEYSRMFVDVPQLRSLARLAGLVEKLTGKSLMRALAVENKKVAFIDLRPEDIILISPVEEPLKALPSPQRKHAAWPCHACTYVNRSQATACVVCNTPKAKHAASSLADEPTGGTALSAAEILNGTLCHEKSGGNVTPPRLSTEDGARAPTPIRGGEKSEVKGKVLAEHVAPAAGNHA